LSSTHKASSRLKSGDMENLAFNIWLSVGAFLVLSEFLLPGLVMVFVGMGSLTVALGMHLGHVNSLLEQFIVFFVSSIIYLITLRFAVLSLVPTNSIKANVDEDMDVVGQVGVVVAAIDSNGTGRIEHSDSTWQAKGKSDEVIEVGKKVKIIGRDNITWIVEKVNSEGE
jgi:membrane protein implicated in regulation of membrane protease activity